MLSVFKPSCFIKQSHEHTTFFKSSKEENLKVFFFLMGLSAPYSSSTDLSSEMLL